MDSTFMYTDEYHVPIMTIDYDCSVEDITFEHLNNWFGVSSRTYAGVNITNCRFLNSKIGIQSAGSPSEITNCIFDSCGKAISLPVWIGDYLISNNLILDCYDGRAIQLFVHSAIIRNNIIINLPGADVKGIVSSTLEGDSFIENNIVQYGTGGIAVDSVRRNNNTVKNTRVSSAIYGGRGTLYNNSISNCRKGTSVGEFTVLNYNNFWRNDIDISGIPGDSIGNIFSNPMYVSEDDFHLQAFSPLIDAGDPDYFDPDGSRSDIGAYGGPLGESYEYLDLAPTIPFDFIGWHVEDTIYFRWEYNTEADFSHYMLYRDTLSGFEPSVFNLIAQLDTSFYTDSDFDHEHNYYYRVASVDNQDNISEYSEELEILLTDIWQQPGAALPKITSIQANYPNPFNTSTTILYTVADLGPLPAEIEINIYDITGRKVRTLVNERRELGEHIIIWNGRDDSGLECASGVYFARISQWGLKLSGKPKNMLLVK